MGGCRSFVPLLFAAALVGCGSETTPVGALGAGGGVPIDCPSGHLVGPDGACLPVGIQGCAELFIEDDNLCHPSMDKCPAGTIPKFDEGCVPVGIQGCAELFMEDDGLCHPSMDKCPEGTFAVPLDGCIPIDGPDGCGTGTWGNIPDGPDTIWVDPSYSGGDSDGSKSKPVLTIAAALDLVVSGGRISLAAGQYDEPVSIDTSLDLVGRCASMVTISGLQQVPNITTDVIIRVGWSPGVTIRNVRLSGAGIGVLARYATLSLEGVHIAEATMVGVLTQGGEVTLDRTLIRRTLPAPTGPAAGAGVEATFGAHVTINSSAIIDSYGPAIVAFHDGTELTATTCLMAGAQPRGSDPQSGEGVLCRDGAHVTLSNSAVVDNHYYGLFVADTGTEVTATASLIAGTLPQQGEQQFGLGAIAQDGAQLTLNHSAVVDNHGMGISVSNTGTELTSVASLIARTLPRPSDQKFGMGIGVRVGAHATLSNSAVIGNRNFGVYATEGEPSLTVTGSLIADTLPQQLDGGSGMGVGCSGCLLTLDGSSLRGNHTAAFGVWGGHATVDAAIVDGVLEGQFFQYEDGNVIEVFENVGDGLLASHDASVFVTDTRVEGCSRVGILYADSSGVLSNAVSTNNRFGMSLQGDPMPTYDDTCIFENNTEKDILSSGNLPVPTAPPDMPEPP